MKSCRVLEVALNCEPLFFDQTDVEGTSVESKQLLEMAKDFFCDDDTFTCPCSKTSNSELHCTVQPRQEQSAATQMSRDTTATPRHNQKSPPRFNPIMNLLCPLPLTEMPQKSIYNGAVPLFMNKLQAPQQFLPRPPRLQRKPYYQTQIDFKTVKAPWILPVPCPSQKKFGSVRTLSDSWPSQLEILIMHAHSVKTAGFSLQLCLFPN